MKICAHNIKKTTLLSRVGRFLHPNGLFLVFIFRSLYVLGLMIFVYYLVFQLHLNLLSYYDTLIQFVKRFILNILTIVNNYQKSRT